MKELGELLFVGFEGTTLTPGVARLLGDVRPGGIILFKRNIQDPDQTLRLIQQLKALYSPAPLIGVDEEGGRVSRLHPVAPTIPPAAELAPAGPGRVRELSACLGRVLRCLGFDIDFAPVVDLCRPDAPNGIGDRSFGLDPRLVTELAAGSLSGLADAGIAGCLKHFPGLGPTLLDSHHHLPAVQKESRAFHDEDLEPYRKLHHISPLVMVGHGHYPFLAGDNPIAASLTAAIATDLLRREVGFAGVAVADDLEMKAVSARVPVKDLAPRALTAGCDMLLVCRHEELIRGSLDALAAWRKQGRLEDSRIDEALGRIRRLREAVAALQAPMPVGEGLEEFRTAAGALESRLTA